MFRLFALAGVIASFAQQPPPSTDIYLVEMSGGLESLKNARPQPIAAEKGYENQPSFTPDGSAILFTANRDGKQMDIYEHTRGGSTRQLIATEEGEYSPTITPDGAISVIRVEADGTQRLWRFERNGTAPRVLITNVKPVGYHAWIDGGRLALFVLGPPATLQLARPGEGPADIVATDIGRSIHRIPGGRAVSFVQREADGKFVVKQLDPDSKRITAITEVVAGSSDRDTAWMPDGTLLMSAGARVFAWKRGDASWREVFDVKPHGLGNVSRLSVSPDGRALAFVVAGVGP
jgi:Tol biopolymer transport system component